MIVPSQLALKTYTNFGFPLPAVSPSIGDTSLTHVMRLAAHSITSPMPTAMGQSFIITLYKIAKLQ
jgi:hypothetical protein